MSISIYIANDSEELGKRAAARIAELMNNAISTKGHARFILSTGQSQFETLKYLVKEKIDWSRTEMFHLDEYIGIPETHPASFRKYLQDRFVSIVHPMKAWFVDSPESIARLSEEIRRDEIDIGVIGIGENGHIAFNDPPADFSTDEIYRIVSLDERCRRQQVGEGWFSTLEDVPEKAITMCPKAILSARHIVSAVPHSVKADAVRNTIIKPVDPMIPATLLKTHPDWNLFLDRNSASELLSQD